MLTRWSMKKLVLRSMIITLGHHLALRIDLLTSSSFPSLTRSRLWETRYSSTEIFPATASTNDSDEHCRSCRGQRGSKWSIGTHNVYQTHRYATTDPNTRSPLLVSTVDRKLTGSVALCRSRTKYAHTSPGFLSTETHRPGGIVTAPSIRTSGEAGNLLKDPSDKADI